jgi:hypothetical protein
MKDAPSYFEYWASGDARERCARHYADQRGGIPLVMNMSFTTKKLNDGNTYVLGYKAAISYPKDYPL